MFRAAPVAAMAPQAVATPQALLTVAPLVATASTAACSSVGSSGWVHCCLDRGRLVAWLLLLIWG